MAPQRGRSVIRLVASRLVLWLAIAALVTAPAAAQSPPQTAVATAQGLRVMTYNLYVGSGFNPVLSARTQEEFTQGVTAILDAVRASDPPARMAAAARQIAAARPHLVSLQEVATWSTGPSPAALEVEFDFLDLLLRELSGQGLAYTPVAVLPHFTFTAPDSAGRFVRVVFRVAVLARSGLDPGVFQVSSVESGLFSSTQQFPVPAMGTAVPFSRGWAAADATYNGRPLRFIATHLEAFSAAVAAEQAGELLAGPANTSLPVIVAGDLNADAANPAHPAYPAYQAFLDAGFTDAWPAANGSGLTCCLGRGGAEAPQLRRRIDLLLYRGPFAVEAAAVGGAAASDRTPGSLWPSDHAAVAAALKFAEGN